MEKLGSWIWLIKSRRYFVAVDYKKNQKKVSFYLLDTQVSLAPTPVSPSVHNTFGYPFWDLTKRRDNIALAAMVAELVADMEVHMMADMEVDKVADKVAAINNRGCLLLIVIARHLNF